VAEYMEGGPLSRQSDSCNLTRMIEMTCPFSYGRGRETVKVSQHAWVKWLALTPLVSISTFLKPFVGSYAAPFSRDDREKDSAYLTVSMETKSHLTVLAHTLGGRHTRYNGRELLVR